MRLPGPATPTHHDQLPVRVVPVQPAAEPPNSEARLNRDYSNRKGYAERFIRGHTVPLPRLSKTLRELAAPNREPEDGEEDSS